jgi:hypothetical protein
LWPTPRWPTTATPGGSGNQAPTREAPADRRVGAGQLCAG